MIGKTISHYKILEKLGEGGMGVVYKAQDTMLDRNVALKFLPEHLLCDEEAKKRFVHEAKAASALNHPNISTIYEISDVEGKCFISMEYIEGKSIKELIRDKKLCIEEIIKIAIQIAEGLSKAHQKDIVHRDIKSDNILITHEGLAKIMDFGLAKLKGATKLTKTGSTIGTLQYMSPEQAQGVEVDQRSDIFSFGVVLYEMITGQLPFKGEHEAAIIYSLVNETPEPLSRYKSNVPQELQRITDKALQKDRNTRYQSAVDIMADLKGLQKATTASIGLEKRIFKGLLRSTPVAWGILLVLVAGIIIVGLLVVKPWLMSEKVEAKSLAVLSFENLGTDVDGYLASGLAEDLAIELRKIAGFRVASSEDTRRLSKEKLLPQQVASRLNVRYALGGSLLKAGDWIRVNVEAIDERSGQVIWSDHFERKFTDVHEFLDEISQKIASALKVQLSPTEELALKEKPTENSEAYDHYLMGRYYYYRITFRDNDFAEREFQRALRLDPNYPLAQAGLADVYLQRYRERFDYDECWLDSSKVLINRALALDPHLAEAHKSLAEVLFEEDNITGALEAAEKARQLRTNYDEPYIMLGNIYIKRGEWKKALLMFDSALALRPSVDAQCGKGNIFVFEGEMDSAKGAYQEAIQLNPDHDRPYLQLGDLYRELSQVQKAETLYQHAIEVRPDHIAGYRALSDMMNDRESIKEGEDLLRKFVERYPYNWDGHEALYRYFDYNIGDEAAANKIVEDAVKLNPNRVWPHLLLAACYAENVSLESDFKKAIPTSEKAMHEVDQALILRPNSGRVLELAGNVYWNLNRLDEALEYYNRSLDIRPGSNDILNRLVWILIDRGEYEKALQTARQALLQSPGNAQGYQDIRSILVQLLNRWQEYFSIIQRVAQEYKDDPRFLYMLGHELCIAGQYKEAINMCRRALEVRRTYWPARIRLAVSLWFSGDKQGALDTLSQVTSGFSAGNWIIAILKSEGRFNEVERYLNSIKEYRPGHLSGMYYWAWMAGPYYMSMRRFDDALTVFNELKRSGKEVWNIDQTLEMAECYRLQGEINSARHLLEESVNVSSNWYRAVIFRNLALLQAISARDLTPAIKLITKAQAELNGPDDWITETMMRLQYASGKVDEALKSLQRLRYFWWGYGEQSNYRYRIAQLKATSGSIDARNYLNEAISNLTRMVRGEWSNGQNVDDASAYLAMALARAGRVDSARQQINWALKLEPERADIAYNAACAYTLVGDTTLALQWLKTAVKRGHQELWWARVDPDLDPLRKLSRFQNIMNDWDSRLRKLLERNPYSNSKQK